MHVYAYIHIVTIITMNSFIFKNQQRWLGDVISRRALASQERSSGIDPHTGKKKKKQVNELYVPCKKSEHPLCRRYRQTSARENFQGTSWLCC